MSTEGERNRLIINHMHLVPMVASAYRGAKGIPFEELEAVGRLGLCQAARDWPGNGVFVAFAHHAIQCEIRNFVRDWDTPDSSLVEPEESAARTFYEWQAWGDEQYANAIAEHWHEVAATPEEIAIAFEEIRHAGPAINSAMIGLTKREREIFHARFFNEPRQTLETIARHHKISYARTVFLLDRIIKNIKHITSLREGRGVV